MTTPDAPEVTLLRRTLHDVAASLDVRDAPMPAEAEAGAAPSTRRSGRWRAPLAVVAAVVLLVAGVWMVLRPTDGADDTAPADDGTTADTGDTPRAAWLPGRLAETDAGGAAGLPVEQARYLTGSGPDDLVVTLDIGAGTDVAELAASYIAPYVGSPVGPGAGQVARRVAAGESASVLWRRQEPDRDTIFGTAGSASGQQGDEVDLRWVPGVGDTASVTYEGAAGDGADGPASAVVELHATAASLPEWAVMATLLDHEAQVEVGDEPAWFVPLPGPGGGHAVIWQAAEGVTAVVTGWRVAEADLLRVAEESRWPASVTVEVTGAAPTTGIVGEESAGPEDWPTLCAARPGDPALPGEEAGESFPGVIGVTGADDIPYELLVWDDRVTAGGPERTGQCWRLTMGTGSDRFRGGGEVVTQGWGPASTLIPVAWTPEETVFFAATADPDVLFFRQGDTVTSSVPAEMDDGTRFTFLRVERTESPDVGFELRDRGGDVLANAGPLPMDRPG